MNGIVVDNNSKYWYQGGKLHRDDGPAVEYIDAKMWYWHGKRHRKGGPAIMFDSGSQAWYVDGELHREDGPAIEHYYSKVWYLHGERLEGRALLHHQQSFISLIVIAAFLPLDFPPYVLLGILQFAYPFVSALDERKLVCFLQAARISALKIMENVDRNQRKRLLSHEK